MVVALSPSDARCLLAAVRGDQWDEVGDMDLCARSIYSAYFPSMGRGAADQIDVLLA